MFAPVLLSHKDLCFLRQLFHTSDGGTIALDWLTSSDSKCKTFDDIIKYTHSHTCGATFYIFMCCVCFRIF